MTTEAILGACVERLHAEVERRHGQGELFFVAVCCNSCGRWKEAESVELLLPMLAGWRLDDQIADNDYCPECAA